MKMDRTFAELPPKIRLILNKFLIIGKILIKSHPYKSSDRQLCDLKLKTYKKRVKDLRKSEV